MGILLDALKNNDIDLNKSYKFNERFVQNQAKVLVLQLFNKLPERQRHQMLKKFLSEKARKKNAEHSFERLCHQVKDQGPEASRRFLTDNKTYGKEWKGLLPSMEIRLDGWVSDSYTSGHVHADTPDEDKLNALFRSETFSNRMDYIWDYVSDDRKNQYAEEFLTKVTERPELCASHFDEEGTFEKGMDWVQFAAAVENSLEKTPAGAASLKDAEKSINAFKRPEQKDTVDFLRRSVEGNLSYSNDRIAFMMQNVMLAPGEDIDADDLVKTAKSKKWRKELDPAKKAEQLNSEGKLNIGEIVSRSKRLIEENGNPVDTPVYQKAALQNYRNIKWLISAEQHGLSPAKQRSSKEFEEMNRHTAQLQAELVKSGAQKYNKLVTDARGIIKKMRVEIEKVKDGFLLSKTNSPEHERMTKSLKLFTAKLDMILDNRTSENLSAEERELVEKSDIKDLYDRAKQDTFNYSCLKTKYGKGSIIHGDGITRNKSARFTFDALYQIGNPLGMNDAATEKKDEIAIEVLRKRGSKEWVKQNAVDRAAKTIYMLSLTHGGMPDEKQKSKLTDQNLNSKIELIKKQPTFKQMVKDLGPSGLCDAILKGDDALTLAYANAAEKVKNPQVKKKNASVEMTSELQHEFWKKEPKLTKQQASPVLS